MLAHLKFLEVTRFYMANAAQRFTTDTNGSWATAAADDALFVHMLPANSDAACHVARDEVVPYYQCWAVQDWGIVDVQAVFVTAPKAVYFETLEALVDAENLPKRTDYNGDWFDSTEPKYQSYMFRQITPANQAETLAAAVRGRFHRMLFQELFYQGFYNEPKDYANQAAVQTAVAVFSLAGVDPCYHHLYGRVEQSDAMFTVPNLRKVQFGVLAADISNVEAIIQVVVTDGPNFDDDLEFLYYRGYHQLADRVLVTVEDEIILAPTPDAASVNTDTFVGCTRGSKGTANVAHTAGTPIFILVMDGRGDYFGTDAAIALAAETFADATRATGMEMLYADGITLRDYNYVGFDDELWANDYRVTVAPMIEAIAKTAGVRDDGRLPEVQQGLGSFVHSWQVSNHRASQDALPFKQKEDTRVRKIEERIAIGTAWSVDHFEFGWWDGRASGIGTPTFDHDTLNWDLVHYTWTKLLAFDTSMGFQTRDGFFTHGERDDLLDLMAVYHELNDRDRAVGAGVVFSDALRTTMKTSTVEGELWDTTGDGIADRFMRKIVDREYAVWSAGTPHDVVFIQTYTNPPYKLELLARPDFLGFGDASNTVMIDFTTTTVDSIRTSSPTVTATVDDSNGDVVIVNGLFATSANVWITVNPAAPATLWDLTGQRGLGFKLTADPVTDALITVRLGGTGTTARRQYQFTVVAGSGELTYILADTNIESDNSIGDHALFNWATAPTQLYITVNNVPGSTTLNMNFDSIEGMEEKANNSRITDPVVTINGRRIVTSGITLETLDDAAYLFEYDSNTGEWGLRDPNRDVIVKPGGSTLTLPDGAIQFLAGANTGTVTSDTTAGYGLRAELWLHVYDDPNSFPVIGAVGDQSVYIGDTLTFTLTGTDADGDALTFGVIDLPTGATLVDGVFSWTPVLADAGSYSVTFTVTDGELGDYETITITVNIPIREPVGKSIVIVGAAGLTMTEVGPSGKGIASPTR